MTNNGIKILFFLFLNFSICFFTNTETAKNIKTNPRSIIPELDNPEDVPKEKNIETVKPTIKKDLRLKTSTVKKEKSKAVIETEKKSSKQKPINNKTLIPFSFKNEKLATIIDNLTNAKGINIIYPQRAADAENFKKQEITYQPQNKYIPIDEAWDIATFFLDLSGYAWFEKSDTLWEITLAAKKEEAGITREPLPTYVGTKPEDLPHSEERIRYLYYLSNLNVAEKNNPLSQILSDMKSDTAADPVFLPRSNGFILIDKANNIASIITLISKLDETGFRESIEIIPLFNVSAQNTAQIFELLKAASGDTNTSPFIRTETKVSASYFTGDTQIVADIRNNALIIMGPQSAVGRIKQFVHNYIDVPSETGKSILHHYSLQYLDAQSFAPILQDIVKTSGGDAQSVQAGVAGPERIFQGVIVRAEKIVEVQQIQGPMATAPIQTNTGTSSSFDAKGVTGQIQMGGNRLIIAAMHEDWIRIKQLIEKLDKPQPQVILEVMIADFTHNPNKLLEGAIRNGTQLTLPNSGIDFLADHIGPVNSLIGQTPQTLATDLLQVVGGASIPTVSSLLGNGPLLISFNDPNTVQPAGSGLTGGAWGLIAILDKFVDARILSHPYLISTNNVKATITQQITRRARGDAQPSQSGVITIQIENVTASIQVQMIPRISAENRLGLQVAVDINDFQELTLNRTTRRVETNANLNSGQIFVIGGLTRINNSDSLTTTPLLYRIPFFGQFFQGAQRQYQVSNVVLFISPTIVQPKLREGLNLYTKDKIYKSKQDTDDNLVFGPTRDPITYLFFNQNTNANNRLIKEYLYETDNAPTNEEKNEVNQQVKKRIKYQPRRPFKGSGSVTKNLKEIPA